MDISPVYLADMASRLMAAVMINPSPALKAADEAVVIRQCVKTAIEIYAEVDRQLKAE